MNDAQRAVLAARQGKCECGNTLPCMYQAIHRAARLCLKLKG